MHLRSHPHKDPRDDYQLAAESMSTHQIRNTLSSKI